MDPAILSALEIPPPPWRPQIVEERRWLSGQARTAERLARKYGDAYARYAEEWGERLERNKQEFDAAAVADSAEDLEALTRCIEEAEAQAERGARERARFAKRMERDTKRILASDPAFAAVNRAFGERLLAIDDRIIASLLDYALFLRAFRAERDPDARGGPVFEDPAALRRHLEALIGA